MAQIMFETFNTPTFYIAIEATLSLNVLLVSYSGDSVTRTSLIYERHSLPLADFRLNLVDYDSINWFMRLLTEQGSIFSINAKRDIANDVKEDFCCVELDFEQEMENAATSAGLEISL
ncbi:actin [Basidiobolus ranarum]|uniref:Actin n=1 Tax=Basidiobolus ranarum TaxID=34480 RepID=A0ABR2WBU2_9FUNG